MKKLYEMIKDLTGITVEEQKINEYLEYEYLDLQDAVLQGANLNWADLQGANLKDANLKGIIITKKQLDKLTVIEEK